MINTIRRFLTAEPFNSVYGTDLIPADLNLPISKYAEDEKNWDDVITSASFLPRVQLYSGKSKIVIEGKFPSGHYGISRAKDVVDDLGPQFDCLPLSWRFKAMRIAGDQILSVYNPKSTEFNKIVAESETPDSGAMYGIEFLLWLPEKKCFVTFFFNSKSSRREAPNLKTILAEKGAATVKHVVARNAKYTWITPVVIKCSTPFTALPTAEEMTDQATRFANPKESEVESVEPVANPERPR